jgi:hypothetical protein
MPCSRAATKCARQRSSFTFVIASSLDVKSKELAQTAFSPEEGGSLIAYGTLPS